MCDRLIDLADRTAHAAACVYHYRHLGEGQWRDHLGDRERVNCKKYFYALRPALAIRWVRLNPDLPPPMNIQAMSNGLDLDGGTVEEIARLLEIKAATRETGDGPRMARIDQFDPGRTGLGSGHTARVASGGSCTAMPRLCSGTSLRGSR